MTRSISIIGAPNNQLYNTSRPDIMDSGLYVRFTIKDAGNEGWQRHATIRRLSAAGVDSIAHGTKWPGAWYDAILKLKEHHNDQEPLIVFVPPDLAVCVASVIPHVYQRCDNVTPSNIVPGRKPLFPPYRIHS